MEEILDSIVDAIHDFLVDLCGGIFIGIFDDANAATGEIAAMVALAFQGFFIMVIVGIYSVLVKDLSTATDLHDVVMKIGAYSIILCLSLFKTSSISKSIFNAH